MPLSGSTLTISSRAHPLVKVARALHTSKGRSEHGLFLVEGAKNVAAALDAKWPLREVLASEAESEVAARVLELGIPLRRATPEVLEAASDAQTPPDIVALAEFAPRALDFELTGLLVIVDGIGDPGNIGTILRAADAAGAELVICTRGSADAFAPKAVRAAAGSVFTLPPLNLEDRSPLALARMLEAKAVPLVTAQAHGGSNAFEMAWPQRCALVLGHETRGVSPEFELASLRATIPVHGHAESLNVAMAATLLCYAWANEQAKVKR